MRKCHNSDSMGVLTVMFVIRVGLITGKSATPAWFVKEFIGGCAG